MTAEQLWQWRDALKSGKYNQCWGLLRSVKADGAIGHCCLGVFSELFSLLEKYIRLHYPAVEGLMPIEMEHLCIQINDRNPLNGYATVIADIEGAPEAYITE